MDIGKQLKELRESKGWSQKEFAERIHRHQTAISKYERGEREPDFAFLREASKLFGVDFLLNSDEKMDYRTMLKNHYNDSADLIQMGYDPEDARRMERENFERYGDMIMQLDYDDRKKVEKFIIELQNSKEKGDR